MAKSIVQGGIFGSLIVFIWGNISWMVLPWHNSTLLKFTNEDAISQVLKENATEDGMYILPHFDHVDKNLSGNEKFKAAAEKKKQGPFIFASVAPNGVNCSMVQAMIINFITNLVAALLITWLLLKLKPISYFGRVTTVCIIALTASFMCQVPQWAWWHFSSSFTIVGIADLLVGWFLAGLVMAKVTA